MHYFTKNGSSVEKHEKQQMGNTCSILKWQYVECDLSEILYIAYFVPTLFNEGAQRKYLAGWMEV